MAAMSGTSPLAAQLLKLDPPVPPSQVRKPRALKLKSSKNVPNAAAPAAGPQKENESRRTIPALDDILNAILPPEPVVDPATGETLLRCVSSIPATRLDALHLQENLDRRLLDRQAREAGVCAVRSQLYAQTFDELIRQVTLECPERGMLLLRVRDDVRATEAAHRMLFKTGTAFGSRKMLTASNGIPELRSQVKRLEGERLALEVRVLELQARCEKQENDAQARRAATEKRHTEEVAYWKKAVGQISAQYKAETDRASTKK